MWQLDDKKRMDAFKLWCWRRLLRTPWTAGRSKHSILKEINPEYSLEGLMLKLKFQYFGHLMWRANSLEKTLMVGKIEGMKRRGNRGWNGWMASPNQWTWVWASFKKEWRTGKQGMQQSMGSQTVRHNRATVKLKCSFLKDFYLWKIKILTDPKYSSPYIFLYNACVLYIIYSMHINKLCIFLEIITGCDKQLCTLCCNEYVLVHTD